MKYVIGHFVSGNLIVVTKRCFTILVKCYIVIKKIYMYIIMILIKAISLHLEIQ